MECSYCSITPEVIEGMMSERELLAAAYSCLGAVMSGQMLSTDFADRMVALTQKLGYLPILENLERHSAKYLEGAR